MIETTWEVMLKLGVASLLVLVLSYVGVAVVRRWAEYHENLDFPNERSSHIRPTPRGGGLAIAVITVSGLLVYMWVVSGWARSEMLNYVAGAVVIAAVSWLDDLRSLPKWVRFGCHSLAAVLAILGFGYWRGLVVPFGGLLRLEWMGFPLTFLWIVGLTNAYNFMDGIDGIAGAQAVLAGLGWALLGWAGDQPSVGILGWLLAVSSLGFLGHNWPPARIFMGDVGSAFLGYTFSVLPVIGAQDDPRLVTAGVMLVWPFVLDAGFTFLRRLLAGENVFSAHRSHLYQRLVVVGYSHRTVTSLYIGLGLAGLLLAFLFMNGAEDVNWLGMFGLTPVSAGLWCFVRAAERRHSSSA